MTKDNPSNKPKKISTAPPPISPLRGYGYIPPKPIAGKPNWRKWNHIKNVEYHQACALSMNIDPDSIKYDRFSGNFEPDTRNEKIKGEFALRLCVLEANADGEHFSSNITGMTFVHEFAYWASEIVNWPDLPPELIKLAKNKNGLGIGERSTNSSTENPMSYEDRLAALFDPVKIAELENMFKANGKWKKWADQAKRNGLISAREGRGTFNPYKASAWFLKQGIEGWDKARCNRTLANNLPARSIESKSMLTGEDN